MPASGLRVLDAIDPTGPDGSGGVYAINIGGPADIINPRTHRVVDILHSGAMLDIASCAANATGFYIYTGQPASKTNEVLAGSIVLGQAAALRVTDC